MKRLNQFRRERYRFGIDVTVQDFTPWMFPHAGNPPSFNIPVFVSMSSPVLFPTKMWKQTLGHDKDAVMKRGHATGLTVGRLNSICSFARYYFVSLMSKELSVLPPNSKSGSFSESGDSGSSIVDGKDRIAGLMTGGAGDAGVSDYTYVTWINFIRKRMEMHGLYANFFLSVVAQMPFTLQTFTSVVH